MSRYAPTQKLVQEMEDATRRSALIRSAMRTLKGRGLSVIEILERGLRQVLAEEAGRAYMEPLVQIRQVSEAIQGAAASRDISLRELVIEVGRLERAVVLAQLPKLVANSGEVANGR